MFHARRTFNRTIPVVLILAALLVPSCYTNEEVGWRYQGLEVTVEYGRTNVTNQVIYDFLTGHDNISVIQLSAREGSMPFYYIAFAFTEWPGYENDYHFQIHRYDDDDAVSMRLSYETELDITGESRNDVLDRVYERYYDDNATAWDLTDAMIAEFNDLLGEEPVDVDTDILLEETYYYD